MKPDMMYYDKRKQFFEDAISRFSDLINDVDHKDGNLNNEDQTIGTLWNGFFPKGECIVLASPSGHGKTFLSIEIAKAGKINNALYINLDSSSERQRPRYSVLNKISEEKEDFKIRLISYTDWKETKKKMEIEEIKELNLEIFNMSQFKQYKQAVHLRNYRNRKLKEKGIEMERKLDNVLVFEKLISEKENENVDFVCIDTWHAFQNKMNFNNSDIDRLIEVCSDKNITLLILHHSSSDKNTLYGKKDLEKKSDSVYVMNELETNENGTTYLSLKMTKSRNINKKVVFLKRKRISSDVAEYEIIDNDNTDEKKIIERLSNIYSNGIKNGKKLSLSKIGDEIYAHIKSKGGQLPFDDVLKFINEDIGLSCKKGTLTKELPNYKTSDGKPYFKKDEGGEWKTISINPEIDVDDSIEPVKKE